VETSYNDIKESSWPVFLALGPEFPGLPDLIRSLLLFFLMLDESLPGPYILPPLSTTMNLAESLNKQTVTKIYHNQPPENN
jgi:hypothetical protein